MKQSFLQSKKFLYAIIVFLLLIVLGIAGVFGYEKYQTIKTERQVEKIHSILDTGMKSYENCEKILEFQSDKINTTKIHFRVSEYETIKKSCNSLFNIASQKQLESFCEDIITGRKRDFKEKYILLDAFKDVQQQCSSKYLRVRFQTGALFDVENDFKSSIGVSFGLPFYKDLENTEGEEFIAHRTAAKQRFIDLLEIQPQVNITPDDIVLHPKSGTLILDLLPETKYSFSLKNFEAEGMEGEKIQTEAFEITTPKNVAFGIRIEKKVSLFRDTDQPNFELYSYNTDKKGANIKICRIPNEQYAKIEVFAEQKGMREEKKNFFLKGIDELKTYKCQEKYVSFNTPPVASDIPLNEGEHGESPSSREMPERQREQGTLKKTSFNFASEIGDIARSGLYYVTFADSAERKTEQNIQRPLFFGVIDSHITMKISRNGKAFFFVNDFAGKPLANQEIRVYANNFISQDKKWNGPKKDYDISYVSPLEKSVFDTPVLLGKTNSQGILEVDMKGKLDDAFIKTFHSYDFDWNGNYNSFFVTSASDDNLTYASSKWNGGIRGWNFGYSQGYDWWYGESENMNEIALDQWDDAEPKLYLHTYTDRKLYLPGEKVFLKSILRNSEDLSIPKGKQITVQIKNPKGKDAAQFTRSVSEYGSIDGNIELPDDAMLGGYQVLIQDGDNIIGRTGFSVEVFKNPKFKNELMLETSGLNDELIQNVKEEIKENSSGYKQKSYSSKFDIIASLSSDYYSGSPVKNAKFSYKVYKQYYYDNSYWDDCYYGCYWEPEKEFYSEGNGVLDSNGKASFSVPVEFSSRYNDYKYIVEATVVDSAGDKISGSNSVIARLPEKYKSWNPASGVYFKTEKRFYKQGEKLLIEGGLTQGNFSPEYFDDFLLVIKKKNYLTHYVKDVRGQKRPITKTQEIVEKILPVNDENFSLKDGKLALNYKLKDTGEYVFEFGKISKDVPFNTQKLLSELQENPNESLKKTYNGKLVANWDNWDMLRKYCSSSQKQKCDNKTLTQSFNCTGSEYLNKTCEGKEQKVNIDLSFSADNILDASSKKYFTLISYGDKNAQNPVESDNKITVLSEKISYKLGETARVMVRLPFSKGKILWTIEKQGVLKREYIDVPGNTFFKEFRVDDSFVPNAYIGVTVVDTDNSKVPEYKVGYTEIVVDKTDKKSDIRITPNKKTYEPREEVSLDIKAERQSELTVMVVDDSLISLMGNVDTNTLEKFYKKLPFQIQTSITNIAMLRNYYFSRQGIVGGSGFGNFKGGDSAVSSRNIFKNTAYYNPSLITDRSGNAKVRFTLPDNLTNFRVMVLSNSKDNFFGYAQKMIEVRKDVLLEDRTPLILRQGDEITLGANVFNTTDKEIGFKASISADGLQIDNAEKNIKVPAGESQFISWKVKNTKSCPYLQKKCEIPYMISLLGDSAKHSDKLEGSIEIKHIPSLIRNSHRFKTLEAGESSELNITLPENTNIEKSLYSLSLSNNPLQGIEKIVKSLAVYPFGCGEQLLSTTLPNAVLQSFTSLLPDTGISQSTIDENLSHGLDKIYDMSLENGAFKYWSHDTQGSIHITAYGVRVLREIQKSGKSINTSILEKAAKYLVSNYGKAEGIEKAESLWALAGYYRGDTSSKLGISDLTAGYTPEKLSRHELIAYTYGLVLVDSKKYKTTIDANISRIEALLEEGKEGSYYYSLLSDMAEFTQLLMDYKVDKKLITKYISQMYDKDWESYWYSTKSKNNAFLAFAKYIDLYGKDNTNTLSLTLAGNTAQVELGGTHTNNYKKDITLSKVLTGEAVNLSVKNVSGATLFASANIQSYPLDPLKITPFSDGVKLSRKVYEVVDSSNISETCRWENGNRACSEAAGLKLHSGNEFKKGATYKIVLEAQFDKKQRRQNLVMEDYIPAGFTILNSKFKTNEIATNQETSEESWTWSHVERNPDLVMAHAKSIWGSSARYKYFVRADFAGEFIYPPAVVYLMYQPDTRANSVFRKVVVK